LKTCTLVVLSNWETFKANLIPANGNNRYVF
jgi:hypothetical protein